MIELKKFTKKLLTCPKCADTIHGRSLVARGIEMDRAYAGEPPRKCDILDEHLHATCSCGYRVEMRCRDDKGVKPPITGEG